jgi:hypothetical protein
MGKDYSTMNSGLPVISCGISIPISDSMVGAMSESLPPLTALTAFIANVDQRNRQVGVGGVRLAGGRVAHLLGVAVVGGDQQLAANGFHRFATWSMQ